MSEYKCPCNSGGTAAEPLPVPVETVDLATPLYQACGGRMYRLHIISLARYIMMSDGVSVEERINTVERSQAANTTLRFADNLAGRDALAGLVPGDQCYVFNATPDTTGGLGAMYLWMPSLSWRKLWEGDSPNDCLNLIVPGGGLGVDAKGDHLLVVCADLLHDGGGLTVCERGRIKVQLADLVKAGGGLAVDGNGQAYVKADDLFDQGNGLSVDKFGHLYVKLEDLLANGGGLEIDGNGKIVIDLSHMTEDAVRDMLANLVSTGNGLKLDADGKLFFDPSDLPPSSINVNKLNLTQLTEEQKKILARAVKPSELIHKGGGLDVDKEDGKLIVNFGLMDPDIMKGMLLGMIANGGGIGLDENGKLRVDLNSLGDDMRDAIMNALDLPSPIGKSRTFHVDKSHAKAGNIKPLPKRSAYPNTTEGYEQYSAALEAASAENKTRGSADMPFDTIQHALDHVCGNFNMGAYTATIQIAGGEYREKITLPSFSATTGHVTLAGTGAVTFDSDGAIATDTRTTRFTGSITDAGGGSFYFNNLKFAPDTSGEGVDATRIWTGESIFPIHITSKATTAYVMNCDFRGAFESGGKSWNGLWVGGGSLTIGEGCSFSGKWSNLWYGQNGANITLSRNALLNNVDAAIILALDNSMFLRAGKSSKDLAVIKTAGTVKGRRYYATMLSVLSMRGADPETFFPGDVAGNLASGSVSSYTAGSGA